MTIKWSKVLTRSDARQETKGSKMPFRFTSGSPRRDQKKWFRYEFFSGLDWVPAKSKKGHSIEKAKVKMHVIIEGNDLGTRTMELDYTPIRTGNHSAPTTHLHYDNMTRTLLEKTNLAGHKVVVKRENEEFSFEIE